MWKKALSECLREMGVQADLTRVREPLRLVVDHPPAVVDGQAVRTVVAAGGRSLIRCAPAGATGRTAVVGKTLAELLVQLATDDVAPAKVAKPNNLP